MDEVAEPRDLGATPARVLGGGEDRERRRWPGLDGSGQRCGGVGWRRGGQRLKLRPWLL